MKLCKIYAFLMLFVLATYGMDDVAAKKAEIKCNLAQTLLEQALEKPTQEANTALAQAQTFLNGVNTERAQSLTKDLDHAIEIVNYLFTVENLLRQNQFAMASKVLERYPDNSVSPFNARVVKCRVEALRGLKRFKEAIDCAAIFEKAITDGSYNGPLAKELLYAIEFTRCTSEDSNLVIPIAERALAKKRDEATDMEAAACMFIAVIDGHPMQARVLAYMGHKQVSASVAGNCSSTKRIPIETFADLILRGQIGEMVSILKKHLTPLVPKNSIDVDFIIETLVHVDLKTGAFRGQLAEMKSPYELNMVLALNIFTMLGYSDMFHLQGGLQSMLLDAEHALLDALKEAPDSILRLRLKFYQLKTNGSHKALKAVESAFKQHENRLSATQDKKFIPEKTRLKETDFERGQIAERIGSHQQAYEFYDRLCTSSDIFMVRKGILAKARLHMAEKRFNDAYQLITKYDKEYPHDGATELCAIKGIAAFELGKEQDACDALMEVFGNSALVPEATFARAMFNLGTILEGQEEHLSNACICYQSVIDAARSKVIKRTAYEKLGFVLIRSDHVKAREAFLAAVSMSKEAPIAQLGLAITASIDDSQKADNERSPQEIVDHFMKGSKSIHEVHPYWQLVLNRLVAGVYKKLSDHASLKQDTENAQRYSKEALRFYELASDSVVESDLRDRACVEFAAELYATREKDRAMKLIKPYIGKSQDSSVSIMAHSLYASILCESNRFDQACAAIDLTKTDEYEKALMDAPMAVVRFAQARQAQGDAAIALYEKAMTSVVKELADQATVCAAFLYAQQGDIESFTRMNEGVIANGTAYARAEALAHKIIVELSEAGISCDDIEGVQTHPLFAMLQRVDAQRDNEYARFVVAPYLFNGVESEARKLRIQEAAQQTLHPRTRDLARLKQTLYLSDEEVIRELKDLKENSLLECDRVDAQAQYATRILAQHPEAATPEKIQALGVMEDLLAVDAACQSPSYFAIQPWMIKVCPDEYVPRMQILAMQDEFPGLRTEARKALIGRVSDNVTIEYAQDLLKADRASLSPYAKLQYIEAYFAKHHIHSKDFEAIRVSPVYEVLKDLNTDELRGSDLKLWLAAQMWLYSNTAWGKEEYLNRMRSMHARSAHQSIGYWADIEAARLQMKSKRFDSARDILNGVCSTCTLPDLKTEAQALLKGMPSKK